MNKKYIISLFLILLLLLFIYKNTEYFPYRPRMRPYVSPAKRNISRDLRCEPIIKKTLVSPWGISTIQRVRRRRCLR